MTGKNKALIPPVKKTLAYCSRKLMVPRAEVCATFVRKDKMQSLNSQYRGIDRPTDVLSFAQSDPPFSPDSILGDIIISTAVARNQAISNGVPVLQEVKMLTIHGLLHLLGYDHAEKLEEERMFSIQNRLLAEVNKIA